jgi:hypothetical protein
MLEKKIDALVRFEAMKTKEDEIAIVHLRQGVGQTLLTAGNISTHRARASQRLRACNNPVSDRSH